MLTVLAVAADCNLGQKPASDSALAFTSLPRVGAVLIVLLVGALAEELMFRGYPFQHLEEGIGAVGAIVVFSVMFGAVHLSNPGASIWGLINTILIGILLSVAYLRTRALWLPWGIHFGWNFALGFLFGLPVSGLRIFNVVVRTSVTGPTVGDRRQLRNRRPVPPNGCRLIGLVIVLEVARYANWPTPAAVARTCSERLAASQPERIAAGRDALSGVHPLVETVHLDPDGHIMKQSGCSMNRPLLSLLATAAFLLAMSAVRR